MPYTQQQRRSRNPKRPAAMEPSPAEDLGSARGVAAVNDQL
jgi:hypothetical protein